MGAMQGSGFCMCVVKLRRMSHTLMRLQSLSPSLVISERTDRPIGACRGDPVAIMQVHERGHSLLHHALQTEGQSGDGTGDTLPCVAWCALQMDCAGR